MRSTVSIRIDDLEARNVPLEDVPGPRYTAERQHGVATDCIVGLPGLFLRGRERALRGRERAR